MGSRRDTGRLAVGWVVADTLHGGTTRFGRLPANVAMRVANPARWLCENAQVRAELYRRGRRYDVVVFAKAMDAACRREAAAVQAAGGRVVFDVNVNYYEVEGEYTIPGTRPTERQREEAIAMTQLADHVVADSSFLLGVVRRFTTAATHIPDNVDTSVYRGARIHTDEKALRLVWSGVASKAAHVLEIEEVLGGVSGIELVLVSNAQPPELERLARAVPCRFMRFSDRRYARVLRSCDVIVSPKRLANAYELAHTEYKITLGMAIGLPALASPQQSYVEAISWKGGGILADGSDEWHAALVRLRDEPELRATLGRRARETVEERYSTETVAPRWRDLLLSLG